MEICVVTLIGIPASGKTSLSHIILKLSRKNLLKANVALLCFDKMMKINYEKLCDGDYKRYREDFFGEIEEMIINYKDNRILNLNDFSISPNNSVMLFILDDNMYYRSMRQRVRQLCKKLNCHYFQIFLETSLEKALERNANRTELVEENVITKMFNDLELPMNPQTITLELSSIDESVLLERLHDRIAYPEILASEEIQKIPQDQSIIHEMDLISRRELSLKIQEKKSSGNLTQISFRLNNARKQFMDDVRCGKLQFSDIEEFKNSYKNFLELQ